MTTRKIQVRRGTSAQWATANTVLAAGEWGYDTTAKISKIGDGSTAWDDLPALRGSLPYSAYLTGGTESNMAGWLAARDSGVGNVLVLGTSHPYGWGTTDPSNDAWPFRLAAKIGATRGMEPLNKFSTEIAQKRSYITVAGTVDRKYDTCVADMGYIDLEGGTGEISYTATCSEFRLIMRDWGGTVQYTIDGGAPQTLTGTSVDSWPKQYVIPAGAAGTHTLRLYSSGGADPEVRMIALGGSGSGITVHNFGIPGTQSINWRKDTGNTPAYMQDGTVSKPAATNPNVGQKWASLVNSVGVVQPDLLVLQIGGGNDTNATIDPVTYGQQLDYIIKWSRGQHSGQTPRSQSIIAVTPFTDDVTTRALRAQMEAVCASNDVPVFDADSLIPDGSPMWGGGHINTAGHELIAEEMSKALMNPLAVPVASKEYVDTADAVLEASLADKAPLVHSHAQSDVTGLDTALSGKASTTHASTHASAGSDPITVAQSQVTGLVTDLAAKASLTGAVFTGAMNVNYNSPTLGINQLGGVVIRRNQVGSSFTGLDIRDGNDATNVDVRLDGSSTWRGDLLVSKANAALTVNASSGNADLILKSVAATQSRLYLQTGSTARWSINKNSSAESGSNAGSNLEINAYNDAGTLLSTPLSIARSTGAATFGNTIAASGLSGSLLSSASPVMDGVASAGTAVVPSRQDHVHPTDTTKVTGPASATDNALTRFDGTGGKTVQNSGITVDDSGKVTTDLTVSKATPSVVVDAASAAQEAVVDLQTGAVTRWKIGKNLAAESGADAGSNFTIRAYSDAGALLSTPLTITRSTGLLTLTGDLTISKGSAVIQIDSASTGSGALYIDATGSAGNSSTVRLRSGTTNRWVLGRNSDTETGTNSGSNFSIFRYDDAGTNLGSSLTITRSTGKTTLGSVGATAGLELGSSGPRVMSGTGSPAGVVSAPVGSQWIDTAATTGAIKWIKASGTGSSGWVVEYGNTGVRAMNAAALGSDADFAINSARLHRSGSTVEFYVDFTASGSPSAGDVIWAVPTGFRPGLSSTMYGVARIAYGQVNEDALYTSGNLVVYGVAGGETHRIHGVWLTNDAWPSSLPGTAA